MSQPDAVEAEKKRYIELKEVSVQDERRESKFRVVLKHNTGAVETFESQIKSRKSNICCQSFIEVKSSQSPSPGRNATIDVQRCDKQQKPRDAIDLSTGSMSDSVLEIQLPKQLGLKALVKFGRILTASEVARIRLEQATAALDTKKGMMGKLDLLTTHLRLFVCLGSTLSEVTNVSSTVVSLVEQTFEKIQGVPKSYASLRDMVLDLVEDLETASEAGKHFETGFAQKALDELILLVIQSAMEVSLCYSHSKLTVFAKELFAPSNDRVEELKGKLSRHKEKIKQAFLSEIKADLTVMKHDVRGVDQKIDAIDARSRIIEEEKLLSVLVPPPESLFVGKQSCLQGTRTKTLDLISEWTDNRSMPSRLFWLYGVAGCGKSTIAVSICERLQSRLAGSFFCKRDQEGRRNPVRLIWTLAYYLARTNNAFQANLVSILRQGDAFVNSTVDAQFKTVLEKPLLDLKADSIAEPSVFVVDALDECEQSETVFRLLSKVSELAPWMLFVVTSRDLSGIWGCVSKLKDQATSYDLFEDDASNDIRAYIHYELGAEGRLNEMEPFMEEHVETFVKRSQGLFIWIRVVVEYIIHTEVGKLEVINSIVESEKHPDSEVALDTMYRTVLLSAAGSTETGKKLVRLILGFILAASSVSPMSRDMLYAFLPPSLLIVEREFATVLRKLMPVLVDEFGYLRTFHASFLDFIATEDRIGTTFFLPAGDLHHIIAVGCFEIMKDGTRNRKRDPDAMSGLQFNICELESSCIPNYQVEDLEDILDRHISPELAYSCINWADYCSQSRPSSEHKAFRAIVGVHITTVSEPIEEFICSKQAFLWLEVLSLIEQMPKARSSLVTILNGDKLKVSDKAYGTVAELRSHLDRFYDIITMSTPHIYISSLPWVSEDSFLWKTVKETFAKTRVLDLPLEHRSPFQRRIECPKRLGTFALSPDGASIALGSYDDSITIWNLHTGSLVKSNDNASTIDEAPRQNLVDSLAYSPDGMQIISGSSSATIINVWDASSLHRIAEPIDAHTKGIVCLAFSYEGKLFASAAADETVFLWNASSHTLSKKLSMGGTITSIAFSPNASRLLISIASQSGERQMLVMMDTRTGERIGECLRPHEHSISSITYSPDGERFATTSYDMSIKIWDAKTMTSIGQPLIHDHFVVDVAWSPDGLVSATKYDHIRIWDPYGFAEISSIASALPFDVRELRFSLDGTRLITHSISAKDNGVRISPEDNGIRIWDARLLMQSGGPTRTRAMTRSNVRCIQISDDSRKVFVGLENGYVQTWDLPTAAFEKEFSAEAQIDFLAFSPSGKYYASTLVNDVQIFDTCSGQAVCAFAGIKGYTMCAAFSRDETLVAWNTDSSSLLLCDLKTGERIGRPMKGYEERIRAISFSPDATRIACGYDDGMMCLWDIESASPIGEPIQAHEGWVCCVMFSPRGDMIASGGPSGDIQVWNAKDFSRKGEAYKEHSEPVNSIVFSADGNHLYSASSDRTIRSWDVRGAKLAGPVLRGFDGPIANIVLSSDGHHLIAGSEDGVVRTFDSNFLTWTTESGLGMPRVFGPARVPVNVGDDGWIRSVDNELLLWIPEEYRQRVYDASILQLPQSERTRPVRIQWDKLCYGEDWEDVCLPED